jgi:flotillin
MNQQMTEFPWWAWALVVFGLVAIVLPLLISRFLRSVDAGTIRLVSLLKGATSIYRGPGKSFEVPLFTTGTTIPSKAINIDLDIADQTADIDRSGQPRPIKVRVLASAIVSVGDTNEMIKTAANKFFSKPEFEQTSTLTDLLTSTGRRAINLLHHDELFNAKIGYPITTDAVSPVEQSNLPARAQAATLQSVSSEDDDRLAIIIKSACSRELQDLGLVFNSLNIKEVQSEVAEARRRQSAVEAKANADIVTADQERRAREAQLAAEQAINDKQRDLDQRKAQNAAAVAEAEAGKQIALGTLREAELKATQIAQAVADAERVKVQAGAQAEAEAIRLRTVASAQAQAIREVNAAIKEGGDAYLRLRQLEMIPQIAPVIANALAQAKMITISSDGRSAAGGTADTISNVIQTVLAAQLVNNTLSLEGKPNVAVPSPKQEMEPRQISDVTSAPLISESNMPPAKFQVPPITSKRKDGGNGAGP